MIKEQRNIYSAETQCFDYEDQIVEDLPRRNTRTPEEYDEEEPRTHTTSTRRYTTRQPAPAPRSVVRYERHAVPARSSRTRTQQHPAMIRARDTDGIPAQVAKAIPTHHHKAGWYMVRAGSFVAVMALGSIVFSLAGTWWHNESDNIAYGYPRTASYDQVLASDKVATHFIAQNNHCHLLVTILAANDAASTSIIDAGTLSNAGCDSVPVILTFKDVTGDGKLDMIVQAAGVDSVFIYDKKDDKHLFRQATSDDKISM